MLHTGSVTILGIEDHRIVECRKVPYSVIVRDSTRCWWIGDKELSAAENVIMQSNQEFHTTKYESICNRWAIVVEWNCSLASFFISIAFIFSLMFFVLLDCRHHETNNRTNLGGLWGYFRPLLFLLLPHKVLEHLPFLWKTPGVRHSTIRYHGHITSEDSRWDGFLPQSRRLNCYIISR